MIDDFIYDNGYELWYEVEKKISSCNLKPWNKYSVGPNHYIKYGPPNSEK